MIIAVLKLLLPTSAAIGRVHSTAFVINQRLSDRPFVCSITQGRKRITAILANSEGWNDKGPSFNHRFEPLYSLPKKSTAVESAREAA